MRLNPIFVGLHADGSLSVLSFWQTLKYSFSFEVAGYRFCWPSSTSFYLPLLLLCCSCERQLLAQLLPVRRSAAAFTGSRCISISLCSPAVS